MVILGIEAAARVAGAALLENGRIVAEEMVNGPLTHSETLMPMVAAVLEKSGKTVQELDAIALTNGPGSFTGLRIAAATAKGLALGAGVGLMPIGTLEALAYNVSEWSGLAVTVMDARRNQLYAAVYQNGECIRQPEALPPVELAAFLRKTGEKCLFLGDASDLYAEFFRAELGDCFRLAQPAHKDLRAGVLAALAEKKIKEGTTLVNGSALTLEYLRKPQAEREREERLKAGEEEAHASL